MEARAGPLLHEGALAVELDDVVGPGIGGPQVAVLVDGDADEAHEMALRRAAAVDRRQVLAAAVELLDHVVARVADVHGAAATGLLELSTATLVGRVNWPGAVAGDARLAVVRFLQTWLSAVPSFTPHPQAALNWPF